MQVLLLELISKSIFHQRRHTSIPAISIQSVCMELFSSNPLYIASIHSYASLVITQLITVVNCPHLKSNSLTGVFRPMAYLPNRSHWSRFLLQRANASSNWYPFLVTIFIAQVSRKSSKTIRYSSLTSSGSFSWNRRMALLLLGVVHGVDASRWKTDTGICLGDLHVLVPL